MDISSLNDKQKQTVTAPRGPVLVLAGPRGDLKIKIKIKIP